MKCPKCSYVSHDYLNACRKCGVDLVTFKQGVGLLVLQPGVLDLSLVLGGAGADDLFEEEEVALHASDDDFDISLDDYAEHPGVRRAPAWTARPGRRETEEDGAGMDHLTLELDASELSAEMTAQLRAAQVIPGDQAQPATPAAGLPVGSGGIPQPGHVTLEMEPESISAELPPGAFEETVPVLPAPPHETPATTPAQNATRSLDIDESQINMALITSAAGTHGAESLDEAVSVDDFSGALSSLQLQDVVVADDTSVTSAAPEPEVVDPTLPTIELLDVKSTFARMEAERHAPPSEAAATPERVVDSLERSVDEEASRPAGAKPAPPGSAAPSLADASLPPAFELHLETLAAGEGMLADLPMPISDEAPLTFEDEDMSRASLSQETMAPTAESIPEGLLTSSDMFALEDLGEPPPPEHLTLELRAPTLPDNLTSSLIQDAVRTPPREAPETPQASASTGAEPGPPAVDAFDDFDEINLPGHLTLELDASEMMPDVSSIILDNLEPDTLPDDVQSKRLSADEHADDAADLFLDLDDFELDDDGPDVKH